MATGISWCDEVWNPVTGCSKVSEGCRNCYAAALAPRLAAMGQKGYTTLPWTAKNAAENVKLHPDRLEKPWRWRKPHRVFVNSMSDLFHEHVPDEFIDKVFAVMALAPQHTFQVLTKRPERMAEYLNAGGRLHSEPEHYFRELMVSAEIPLVAAEIGERALRVLEDAIEDAGPSEWRIPWPLPNVWLGTSVEDQRAADERIPHLLRTPAAVRFLSCEPLIGSVKLYDYIMLTHNNGWGGAVSEARGWGYDEWSGGFVGPGATDTAYDPQPGIRWVVAGGESGPNHRPLDLAWIRSLRDQCAAAGVSFWAKQNSGVRPETPLPEDLQIRQFPKTSGEPSGAGAGS